MNTHPPVLLRPLLEGLGPLAELALDLRWSWGHASEERWMALAPKLWELTHHPWVMLQSAPQARLEQLATDPQFIAEVKRWETARQDYLSHFGWFRQTYPPMPSIASPTLLWSLAWEKRCRPESRPRWTR
jgi:glycogen phosphorylase